MGSFLRDPIRFLRRCHERYGDVFLARFPGLGRVVYVADPASAKDVFTGSPGLFRAGEANARWLEPVLGRSSIMNVDESDHLRQRRMLLPPFHGERIRRYEDIFVEVANREIDSWPVGESFSMLAATQRITLEVMLRAVFGVERERLDLFREAVLRLDRAAAIVLPVPPLRRDFGRFSPWRRFQRALAAVDELFFDEIERARRDPRRENRDDVLALLVSARDEDGEPMSDREVRDELMTLVAAGYETTATTLAWLFERVLRTPPVLARLTADPGDGEYLDAVIKETLRLRSPVTDGTRVLSRDTEVAGYQLPKGILVIVALPLIHQRPDTYADPAAFRPERFLGADTPAYTFIPFGGGSRRCVGAAFAQFELKVVARTVLERARLRAESPEPEGQRLHHVVVVPSRGARVVLEERAPSPKRESAPAAAVAGA
jgi:cytochrome P450